MRVRPLLPDVEGLASEGVAVDRVNRSVVISVASSRPGCSCPGCGAPSTRVHSHYVRTLADLPWQGLQVVIRWRSRRFFCRNASCQQKIFTERLPKVASRGARRTCRMVTALRCIGFACGGEGGARLAERLGMLVSPATLLREIRRTPAPTCQAPRVLGVDDWAYRRGQRYGTILCDLERRCPVDLLPERSSESFSAWLEAHQGVEVISRDRGDYYIKGAGAGAPTAIQVTDRWHLLRNLRDAISRVVDQHLPEVQAAVRSLQHRTIGAPTEQRNRGDEPPTPAELRPPTRSDELKRARRARRLERYEKVRELHREGVAHREIARRLGIHRSTVCQLAWAESFPERASRHYRRHTDPFLDYLRERWQAGCSNAAELYRGLREQGFQGSYDMVRRRVGRWRRRDAEKKNSLTNAKTPQRPSSNRVAWLLLKSRGKRTRDESELFAALRQHSPALRTVADIGRGFRALVKRRRASALETWIERARSTGAPVELRRFARGLLDDLSAVRAALSLPWSNGQTEGHVNRLKLIKRQMYGRASFDLLRQRVLNAA